MQLPNHIFRGYDMRGSVGDEVTPELMDIVGKGFATYLWEQRKVKPDVVVGYDLRPSSEELADALIGGIVSTGADVVNVGQVPTPVVNFSWHLLGKNAAAMVTASHNPPQYNGVKLKCAPQVPIWGAELQEVLALMQRGEFRSGRGTIAKASTIDQYIEAIKSRLAGAKGLRVVVDPGNGSGSQTTPQALRAIGCEVVELYCEPDGTFPNHHPDPATVSTMADLQRKVIETGARLGLAIDGDGDRLGVVDDKGRVIMPDTYLMVLTREALAKCAGKIVIDVASTETLAEDIRAHGGEVVLSKCGYPYLLEKLALGRDYLLGGEVTGHIFFNEPDMDFDDATYAACRMASYLANEGLLMSAVVDDPTLHNRVQTPQVRVHVTDESKFQIVSELADALSSKPGILRCDTTDGVKARFENGWVLARASNTAPDIVLRAESDTIQDAQSLLQIIQDEVASLIR